MEYNLSLIYNEMIRDKQIAQIKDTLALFVIFTQLKRVADQSKNICEETIFSVTGQQKQPKSYKVLFIDEENSYLSQLAEVIARKNYPEQGIYRSAGRSAAKSLNKSMVDFLLDKGENLEGVVPSSIAELSDRELAQQYVIVSLQGSVKSYIGTIPFHVTALEWDISFDNTGKNIDEIYRTIALHIKDLMQTLRGEEM